MHWPARRSSSRSRWTSTRRRTRKRSHAHSTSCAGSSTSRRMADETDIRIPIPRPRPGPLKPPPPGCAYPQSHRTRHPIDVELAGLAANGARCTSIYLDTVEGMSNDLISSEGEEHHQGLARTHKLSDG